MTKVDFYQLSRAVQDSLLASLRGEFAPLPIVVRRGPRQTVAMWLGVAGAAAVVLAVIYSVGLGNIESGLSLHPTWLIVFYAALAATSVIAVLNALASRARAKALPFPAGVFVFPASVIDARDHTLRVHPLANLATVAAGPGGTVVLTFPGERFTFPADDPERAQQAVDAIEAARTSMRSPLGDQERRRLDPLAPPAVASPLTPEIPIRSAAQGWERHRLLAGALLGCVLGAALFSTRNSTSEARLLAWATASNDVASYQRYLTRGQRYRSKVSRELLPRAALKTAIANGSVDAIDAFAKAYPDTDIQTEVATARKKALIAEFEAARAAGKLEPLLAFADKYPDHGLGQVFDQSRHALYLTALARYRSGMSEPLGEIVARLVASAEKAGAKKVDGAFRGLAVQVRFRRVPSKDMDHADSLARQNPMFNGTPSLPTHHLDAARFAPHEKAAAEALAAGLGKAFDAEVATFEAGPPIEGTDEALPAFTTPTLVVSYRVEPSGAAFASKKPRGIFLGLTFFVTAELSLPGDAKTLKTKHSITQRIPSDLLKTDSASAGGPGSLEAAVYDEMVHEAFTEFSTKYLAKAFKKDDDK